MKLYCPLSLTSGLAAAAVAAACLLGTSTTHAATVVAEEAFEAFTGSAWPGTDINGQGGWVVTSGGVTVRDDFTDGSLDGKVMYNSGHAYRNDGTAYVTATDTSVTISFSGRVGGAGGSTDRWSRVGVGYYDGTNLNPGAYFGSQGSVWGVLLGSGTSGGGTLATSGDGFPGDWEIYDMRLTIDLVAETGVMEVKPDGGSWITPSGLGSIGFSSLDTGATDGKNPLNWNSLYYRGIGAGDTADNIVVTTIPEPGSASLLALLGGLCVLARRQRRGATSRSV